MKFCDHVELTNEQYREIGQYLEKIDYKILKQHVICAGHRLEDLGLSRQRPEGVGQIIEYFYKRKKIGILFNWIAKHDLNFFVLGKKLGFTLEEGSLDDLYPCQIENYNLKDYDLIIQDFVLQNDRDDQRELINLYGKTKIDYTFPINCIVYGPSKEGIASFSECVEKVLREHVIPETQRVDEIDPIKISFDINPYKNNRTYDGDFLQQFSKQIAKDYLESEKQLQQKICELLCKKPIMLFIEIPIKSYCLKKKDINRFLTKFNTISLEKNKHKAFIICYVFVVDIEKKPNFWQWVLGKHFYKHLESYLDENSNLHCKTRKHGEINFVKGILLAKLAPVPLEHTKNWLEDKFEEWFNKYRTEPLCSSEINDLMKEITKLYGQNDHLPMSKLIKSLKTIIWEELSKSCLKGTLRSS